MVTTLANDPIINAAATKQPQSIAQNNIKVKQATVIIQPDNVGTSGDTIGTAVDANNASQDAGGNEDGVAPDEYQGVGIGQAKKKKKKRKTKKNKSVCVEFLLESL
jgi:hypothetical protein